MNCEDIKEAILTYLPDLSAQTYTLTYISLTSLLELLEELGVESRADLQTSIMLETDPCATSADIQRTQELPSTPCLIVQGDLMKPRAWMLSIEEQVVMGPHSNILNGLAALFASFYNLNLQYPEDSSCTLEFIQRCFLGINPETGSKTKRKRGGINAHVTDLNGRKRPLTAETLIIATGDRPQYLGIPGDREYCLTSEDLLSLPHSMGRTLIVGGSAEGLECASFPFGLGLPVTVMSQPDLLLGFDQKMTQKTENHMIVSRVEFLYHLSRSQNSPNPTEEDLLSCSPEPSVSKDTKYIEEEDTKYP